jgi:hypothetical protein
MNSHSFSAIQKTVKSAEILGDRQKPRISHLAYTKELLVFIFTLMKILEKIEVQHETLSIFTQNQIHKS